MPLFELQGPDGETYEVDAPDEGSAVSAFQSMQQPKQEPATSPLPAKPKLGQPSYTPATPDGLARNADNIVRSVANGMTFNMADEIAAAGNTALGSGSYDDNLKAERTRDAAIPADQRIGGEILGGIATGTGLGKAGVTLLNAAKPTIANMALRGAGEGAAYGAAYGFGSGEGGQDRLEKAGVGAVTGAVGGGATGAAAGAMARQPAAKALTTSELKAKSTAAYRNAERAGVIASRDSFDNAVQGIAANLEAAGIDKTIHPRATAALGRLQEATTGDVTLKKLDVLRRVASAAAKSNEPDERRLASMIIGEVDDYVQNLQPGDLVAGDSKKAVAALTEARDLWSKAAKSSTIEGLIERAKTRASQFSGSGMENALRVEFRGLAMNDKRMRGFSQEEQDAIKKVAEGGPMVNALRMIGKMAPRGVISGGFNLGVGAAIDPITGMGTMLAGEAARQGATALTRRNALLAGELTRGGGQPTYALSPAQLEVLRAGIIGQAQEVPPIGRAMVSTVPR